MSRDPRQTCLTSPPQKQGVRHEPNIPKSKDIDQCLAASLQKPQLVPKLETAENAQEAWKVPIKAELPAVCWCALPGGNSDVIHTSVWHSAT